MCGTPLPVTSSCGLCSSGPFNLAPHALLAAWIARYGPLSLQPGYGPGLNRFRVRRNDSSDRPSPVPVSEVQAQLQHLEDHIHSPRALSRPLPFPALTISVNASERAWIWCN